MRSRASRIANNLASLEIQAGAAHIARLAREALIAEVELTPKPGLVDRRGPGAHRDLSLALLRQSAYVIEPFFRAMAFASVGHQPSQILREQLSKIGRDAEHAMLSAAGNVNTHRGAIWIMGLLVSSTAMHIKGKVNATEIAITGQQIASFADRAAPRLVSHGDVVRARYGVHGARGEAISGFPHVINIALPTLRRNRAVGLCETESRIDTLLAIISSLKDTCILYRGGLAALAAARNGAVSVLNAGGSGTSTGKTKFESLEHTLLDFGVSPGGSADLLAATLFLDALENGESEVRPDRSSRLETNGIS